MFEYKTGVCLCVCLCVKSSTIAPHVFYVLYIVVLVCVVRLHALLEFFATKKASVNACLRANRSFAPNSMYSCLHYFFCHIQNERRAKKQQLKLVVPAAAQAVAACRRRTFAVHIDTIT